MPDNNELHREPEPMWPTRTGSVPVPDPTKLTTDAVAAASAQWDRALQSMQDLIGARLDAMDKATDLRLEYVATVPNLMRQEIHHLEALHDERFRTIVAEFTEKFVGVERTFASLDSRTDQEREAAKEALAAALASAKELTGAQTVASAQLISAQADASAREAERTAAFTTKQIDQINLQFEAERKAWDQRWQELKERIDRGDRGGYGEGAIAQHVEQRAQRTEQRVDVNLGLQLAVAFLILLTVAVSIYATVKP
jgi:hypothetical protein